MPSRVLRFRVTVVDLQALQAAADEVGVPLSTLIREAVALYVADLYDEPTPTFPVNTPTLSYRPRSDV